MGVLGQFLRLHISFVSTVVRHLPLDRFLPARHCLLLVVLAPPPQLLDLPVLQVAVVVGQQQGHPLLGHVGFSDEPQA